VWRKLSELFDYIESAPHTNRFVLIEIPLSEDAAASTARALHWSVGIGGELETINSIDTLPSYICVFQPHCLCAATIAPADNGCRVPCACVAAGPADVDARQQAPSLMVAFQR
jgi:hypothetical protein